MREGRLSLKREEALGCLWRQRGGGPPDMFKKGETGVAEEKKKKKLPAKRKGRQKGNRIFRLKGDQRGNRA